MQELPTQPVEVALWCLTILKLRNDSLIKASSFAIDLSIIYMVAKYSPKQIQFPVAHGQAQLCNNSLTTVSWK